MNLRRCSRSANENEFSLHSLNRIIADEMKELKIVTKRGTLLDGMLFGTEVKADTVLICITGIHGNFYSNPFYYNIGNTLSAAGIDFIYAQTNDAFGAAMLIRCCHSY